MGPTTPRTEHPKALDKLVAPGPGGSATVRQLEKYPRLVPSKNFGITLGDALAVCKVGSVPSAWESKPTSKAGNPLAWAMDHDHQCCPSGRGLSMGASEGSSAPRATGC